MSFGNGCKDYQIEYRFILLGGGTTLLIAGMILFQE